MKASPLLLIGTLIFASCTPLKKPTTVTMAMHRAQVLEIMGEPIAIDAQGPEEHLLYSDRVVKLGNARVIGIEPLPAPIPSEHAQRTWSRDRNGRWSTDDRQFRSRQSLGAGSSAATPRRSTSGNDIRDQWGWDPNGTALDQPARR